MSDLVTALLAWIGANSGYAIPGQQPNIALLEPYQLCQRYGVHEIEQCRQLKIKGIYDKKKTIYLRNDFVADDIEEQSRLLHELVHWVQWSNGRNKKSDCMGELEVEAYELQDRWRAGHGLAARRDEFTMLMLQASCSS